MSYLDQRVASNGAASSSLPSPRCALRSHSVKVIPLEAFSRKGWVRCTLVQPITRTMLWFLQHASYELVDH